MATSLAERFGPDTLRKFQTASIRRNMESACLAKNDHRLAALYLLGYTAEMIIKSAYFQLLRYGPNDPIDRDARNRAMGYARQLGLMTADPHDIPGWARLLIYHRQSLALSAYTPKFARQLEDSAVGLYNLWRPQMRYRVTDVSAPQLEAAQAYVDWLTNHALQL